MGKSVVDLPVSLPSTTFKPVTPSPAFHPSVASAPGFGGFEKSHSAPGSAAFLLGDPSTLALSNRSTSRTTLDSGARRQAVSRSRQKSTSRVGMDPTSKSKFHANRKSGHGVLFT